MILNFAEVIYVWFHRESLTLPVLLAGLLTSPVIANDNLQEEGGVGVGHTDGRSLR